MSKQTIIISGDGASVKFGATTLGEVNTIAFNVRGERQEINLTTIDATKFKTKLLAKLKKISDIVVNKKSDPEADAGLYSTDMATKLEISYAVGGGAVSKKATFYAQCKSVSASTLEREPGDGINVDVTFYVTNLNSLATGSGNGEVAPTITGV